MSKKLLVINPEQCVEVQFDQQITIGRDVFNSLCLKDPELSRSHAIMFEQDGETVIKDLRSRNGVYVRGERAAESVLRPNDEIILGSSVLIFEPTEQIDMDRVLSKRGKYLIDKRAGKIPGKMSEPENIFSTAEMEKALESLFSKPDGSTYFDTSHAMCLLQAIREMDAATDAATLFDCTLRRVLAGLGGHRGVIMQCGQSKEHLKVRSIVSSGGTETIMIGQPVLRVVLGAEKCIFCPDLRRDKRYEQMAAKCQRPIHSFVAAPIKNGTEVFGFIYLDSEDGSVSYDFASLRTLYFIAFHIGALMRVHPRQFPQNASQPAPVRVRQ